MYKHQYALVVKLLSCIQTNPMSWVRVSSVALGRWASKLPCVLLCCGTTAATNYQYPFSFKKEKKMLIPPLHVSSKGSNDRRMTYPAKTGQNVLSSLTSEIVHIFSYSFLFNFIIYVTQNQINKKNLKLLNINQKILNLQTHPCPLLIDMFAKCQWQQQPNDKPSPMHASSSKEILSKRFAVCICSGKRLVWTVAPQ